MLFISFRDYTRHSWNTAQQRNWAAADLADEVYFTQFNNKESELISGSLGLLDFTSSPDMDSQEETDFRRQMQQKPKKKRTRGFKL